MQAGTFVLAELKAEDAQSAVEFRNKAEAGGVLGKPEITGLKKLERLWRLTFPGRKLDLSTYDPKVRWSHTSRTTEHYNANEMSDGERGALYLITRILRASPGVVIVDEPEVHFHALLARSFWDVAEAERPDCRFIYITHDLPFALSRSGARIGIVTSSTELELVPENSDIPPKIYESILGAASLSVIAKRIVFCEGKYGQSLDIHVYGTWFQSPDTVVVPVGGCGEVRQAVSVFATNPLIKNATPLGVVERDFWPDYYLADLAANGLHVLPAHEIEGLLCLREVAEPVAHQIAHADFPATFAAFEDNVRRKFAGVYEHKLILERAKREVDCKLVGLANAANPDGDLKATRDNFTRAVDVTRAIPDVGAIFDAHRKIVSEAIAGSASKFLKILPGKDCLGILCGQLGVTKERYLGLITTALNQPDVGGEPKFEYLRQALVAALTPHLPARA
jgi:AAA domain, putative AbiEii toxin, Type IV TA system